MNKIMITETPIKGLSVLETAVHFDTRGCFQETYNKKDFMSVGIDIDFIQDNQSISKKGVIRGLHFQKKHPHEKLVRVTKGEVFDVAVDLRRYSSTFGYWFGIRINEFNNKQILIPKGFAHGFLVLSNEAELCYKCSDYYYPEDEGGLIWNDKTVNIEWPNVTKNNMGVYEFDGIPLTISEKDNNLPSLNEAYIF